MKKGNKNKENDFKKILEDEEPSDRGAPLAPGQTTQVDDTYIKSLKEKMDRSEESSEPPASSQPAKHRFVEFKKKEKEAVVRPESDSRPTPEPKRARKQNQRPLFPFSEKTTQKLEEEIRKSSSQDTQPSPPLFRSEHPSWHGNSIYVLCGPDAGKSFYITGDKIKIGRGIENDVVLKDIAVSRKHCLIVRKEGQWTVEDLGSDNGTFLDSQPVRKSGFRPGQYVQIGRTIIVLESS
jgi:hypothetical protein